MPREYFRDQFGRFTPRSIEPTPEEVQERLMGMPGPEAEARQYVAGFRQGSDPKVNRSGRKMEGASVPFQQGFSDGQREITARYGGLRDVGAEMAATGLGLGAGGGAFNLGEKGLERGALAVLKKLGASPSKVMLPSQMSPIGRGALYLTGNDPVSKSISALGNPKSLGRINTSPFGIWDKE
jgi:hypothetical protein